MAINHDLNARISEKVMGKKAFIENGFWYLPGEPQGGSRKMGWPRPCKQPVPDFSGDISQAWRVVERMREKGYSVSMKIDDEYTLKFAGKKTVWVSFTKSVACHGEHSDTFPESACRAALAALENQ